MGFCEPSPSFLSRTSSMALHTCHPGPRALAGHCCLKGRPSLLLRTFPLVSSFCSRVQPAYPPRSVVLSPNLLRSVPVSQSCLVSHDLDNLREHCPGALGMSHHQGECVVFLVTRLQLWVWGKTGTGGGAIFIAFSQGANDMTSG